VAAALRRLDAYDEIAQARITLSRTLARALDELEADPEGTKYTIGSVGRVLRDVYADLAVPFGTDRSLDELLAALRADDDDLPTDTRNPPQP
jgi:hypothetical protein